VFVPIVLFAAAALSISREAQQGGVIRIDGAPAQAAVAALQPGGREVPMFNDGNSARRGLVPVLYNLEPGHHELLLKDAAGAVVHKAAVTIRSSNFKTQNIRATRRMKQLKASPGELEAMRAMHTTVTDIKRWEEQFAPPVSDCANSPFRVTRLHNGKPSGNYHRGLDQASPPGAPIRAAASGTVKVARMFAMHGGTVGIDHGQGLTSHYLQMSKVIAKEGRPVQQGEVLGLAGSTGFATGPRLHWWIYLFAVPIKSIHTRGFR